MALLFGLVAGSPAATLLTTNVVSGGSDWTAAIWKTNVASTNFFAPVPGNVYQCVSNGVVFGNNKNNTRIRNPAVPGWLTFPGDSLTLGTNTELRMKTAGAILNFPGVGSNPGLILNGGVLNPGDDTVFVITGKVQVAAQSYWCPGNNGGGTPMPQRGIKLAAQLSGGGTLVIMQATNVVPQQVSGIANTFSGKWIIKAGWLLASSLNSLGTNSITVDPNYVLPLDSSVVNVAGPAWFEPAYDLNSAGRLTLTNGGLMVLHQDCTFSSVRVEGTALTAGTHSYAELAAIFPNNFATAGSGSITVRAYVPPPPQIAIQPLPVNQFPGSLAQLTVIFTGSMPSWYQWQRGTNGLFVNTTDAADITGSHTNRLTFSALAYADSADYRLVATNSAGAVTSQVATVTVLGPLVVAAASPPAGSAINSLTQVQVTFSRNVLWVDAADFLVNGLPALAVSPASGGFSNYVFTFTQPNPGTITISWDSAQGISDLFGNPFDATAPGATWTYTLRDTLPPTIIELLPAPGATVRQLTQVEATFSEPVQGVISSALLINGQAATNVTGAGSGPYLFKFPPPPPGVVQLSWASANAITDTAVPPNSFAGVSWNVTLNPAAGQPAVRINEFLAKNISTNGLVDQFGNLDPWIELYNFGTNDLNLAGFSLTDDPDAPGKWVFPSIVLPAGQFLVVFADGLDVRDTLPFHTSFSLNVAGEYLGFFDNESPRVALSEFVPAYPPQRNDFSYGLDSGNGLGYFATPTPGAPNGSSSVAGVVADVHFSVQRGFFEQPFHLVLTTETPGAVIRYTTDGSQPTELTTGTTYTEPLMIDHLTVLRAAAFSTNSLPSLVQTHSYIFLTNVLNQPADPPRFPITTGWSSYGWPSDYGMDPLVVIHPLYAPEINSDLLAIPALSLAVNTDEMFGPNGIYTNSPPGSFRPEIECSAELVLPDRTPGFQIDCGVKIHGGGSAQRTLKKPFALKFRGEFGLGALNYQFFPDSPISTFDGGLVLRADYNNHWVHGPDATQRSRGGLVRDAFSKDLQLAMGDLGSHSRYVHLYINGLYWGVYNPCEDPDRHFAAAYLGGNHDDYDTVKGSDNGLVVDGDMTAFNTLASLANSGLASLSQYNQIRQLLDVPQFADYMLIQFYSANWDWGPQKNWIAVHNKIVPGALWKFLCWDDERTLEGVNDNLVGSAGPVNLQANLALNPEYRLLFADRANRFLFQNAVLTTNTVAGLWLNRAAQIHQAIVCESARWGDSVPGGKLPLSPLPYPSYDTNTPYYSRDENWLGEQGRLLTNYFPLRTGVLLNQLRAVGLYPPVTAPVFNQRGGNAPAGFNLTMTAPAGTIYYTTNGLDPRVYGLGSVSAQAAVYSNALVLNQSVLVKARVLSGTNWSALTEGDFAVATLQVPLCITEIMFQPPGGSAYEFIELQNLGSTPVDVSGFSFSGITFTFPNGTIIQPGAVLLLANNDNPAAFAGRYPGAAVFAYYSGSLDNSGERIAVLDRNGQIVTSVTYNNGGGWPAAAAGGGYSLELIDPYGDPNSPANWRASTLPNGTPGLPAMPPPPSDIVLNEIMASNLAAVQNGTNFPDWVELYNRSTNVVSIASWSLTDSGNTRKYVFPAGTTINAGDFLTVWCDSATNDPGLHAGFALDKSGDNLFLYDASTNRVDAVSFGQQITDLSIGRISDQWELTVPTPNSLNAAAITDGPTNLVINEWLTNPLPGGVDWIELFNCATNASVALRGLYLASSNAVFQLRSPAFLAPYGFIQLFADEQPGPDHLDFKLPAGGGILVLYDQTCLELGRITYGAQDEGVSEGRLPDGSANVVSFPGTASPGASNYVNRFSGPVLNEFMARNVSAVRDSRGHTPAWLELYNPALTNVSLAGMILALANGGSGEWRLPTGVTMPAGGYITIWCDPSRPASTNLEPEPNTGFTLDPEGATIVLLNTNAQLVDSVSFGFQIPDISVGRSGAGWSLLLSPTPGLLNAPACALGDYTGLRVNEWMADPAAGADWFEIYNPSFLPVNLAGLFLSDDPSITGMTNTVIGPLSFVAPRGWVIFQADARPGQGPNHAGFGLSKDGETIRLYSASGNLIDAVDFGLQTTGVSQGRYPDGANNIIPFPGTSTPGGANRLPSISVGPALLSGSVMQLSWPASSPAYILFSTTNLISGPWQPYSRLPILSNGWFLLDITPGNLHEFYRLGL